jgi:hypothetical protein
MTTFLFWNLNNKPLHKTITNLVLRHDVDVLMFVECTIPPEVMLATLNQQARPQFSLAKDYGICKKVVIYTRFSRKFLTPRFDDTDRLTIRHFKLPALDDFLLAVVHLGSKMSYNGFDQLTESIILADHIRKVEEKIGHSRTVLVGDFNMNPFENGIVNAKGLHAVMTRDIAADKERKIKGKAYPYFYNPMWKFFGDGKNEPPGTYYYRGSTYTTFFWNIFDQVLLRPVAMSFFNNDNLKIISEDGEISFLKNGRPDSSVASDHLPILFKLNL